MEVVGRVVEVGEQDNGNMELDIETGDDEEDEAPCVTNGVGVEEGVIGVTGQKEVDGKDVPDSEEICGMEDEEDGEICEVWSACAIFCGEGVLDPPLRVLFRFRE